jgi:pimeloyl-ACP methyl ester carboxylesterase
LLHALNLSPAYIAGASYGCTFSLYMAHRYPDDVRGLILMDPGPDDPSLMQAMADAQYSRLAEIAERNGMEAVIDHSTGAWTRRVTGTPNGDDYDRFATWLAECIQKNPASRADLLATNPTLFATSIRTWLEWGMTPGFYRANLSDQELARITVPAIVLPGHDEVHPLHTAKELARLLSNAQLADYSDRYTAEEIQRVRESDSFWTQQTFLCLPYIEEFLHREASS